MQVISFAGNNQVKAAQSHKSATPTKKPQVSLKKPLMADSFQKNSLHPKK